MAEDNNYFFLGVPSVGGSASFLLFFDLLAGTSTTFPSGSTTAIGTMVSTTSDLFLLVGTERSTSVLLPRSHPVEVAPIEPALKALRDDRNFFNPQQGNFGPYRRRKGVDHRICIFFACKKFSPAMHFIQYSTPPGILAPSLARSGQKNELKSKKYVILTVINESPFSISYA